MKFHSEALASVATVLSGAVLLLMAVTTVAHAQTDLAAAVSNLEFREIGPAVMGGRITDVAVVESKPQVFYVGTASGGLWKTENHGDSWTPLFDNQPTASIGDVTLAPSNPNIVWVGTGEPQNRQSSPWGAGVFKSTDAGRTWSFVGLEETRHIARIVVHPRNPDVAHVAAVGHLWGANEERGVYRTLDGGATWERVLYIDEHTGAIDLAIDPGDPNTLFAAMYQRQRTGFGFNGGGPGSGIYRTLDGGTTWTELTNGLPEGDKGRIGLDVYRHDGNMVYAVIEADKRDPTRGFSFGEPQGPRKSGVFRSTDRGDTWERMSNTNPRPMYYSQIRIDPSNPDRIYVLGTQLAISDDAGKTFRNDGAEAIHVDHHAMWIDPNDSDHLILGNDGGIAGSFDGAKTWREYDNLAIGQFYQINVDMRDPYYVCGGLQDNSSWCAPSNTRSMYGIRNNDWYDVSGGDGFFNVIDPTDHTIMYSESQGGNMSRVDVTTGEGMRIRPVARPLPDQPEGEEERSFRFNWCTPVVISSHDPAVVYTGANVLLKTPDRGVTWQEMSPDLTKQIDRKELEIMGVIGSEPMLSPNDGISTYGNITTIGESPLNAGLLYVGTDDGNLQQTRDGGATWMDLTSNIEDLPERTYVSRLVASRHVEGRVYATFDGHRNDDYAAHVYVSEDFGERWEPITTGLPHGWSVNVIVEHFRNPNLLFVGNEIGVYFSVDRGENWVRLKNNFPTVPVDDIVIHPRDNDLVVGTHGRSAWILADVTPLEQLANVYDLSAAHVFPVTDFTNYSMKGGWPFAGVEYAAENPPFGALVRYYLKDGVTAAEGTEDEEGEAASEPQGTRSGADDGDEPTVTLTILDSSGEVVRELEGSGNAGINEVVWDLRLGMLDDAPQGQGGGRGAPRAPKVLPGNYSVRLEVAAETSTAEFGVIGDPRIQISRADLQARQDALLSLFELNKALGEANRALGRVDDQVADIQELMEGKDGIPEELIDAAATLKDDLDSLRQDLSQVGRTARVSGAIEGSTTRPTNDQLWQMEKVWDEAPGLIEQLNAIITTRLPALYADLDEHGVRPDPGEAVVMPRRPGGR
jgi:photosystem II stability/assembly factor-like uncharacterized protein